MKTPEFREWLSSIDKLSRSQKETTLQSLGIAKKPEDVVICIEKYFRPICTKCQGSSIYRWGHSAELQRYRCKVCGHTFSALSGTPLARLRHKEQWLTYSQALIDGLTVRKAAAYCNVHKNTSFRWRHRFLKQIEQFKPAQLQGIVEADETFFPLSYKGQRELPRQAHRRGHECHKQGISEEQVPVLILRDRQGVTIDFKLKKANTAEIEPILDRVIAKDALLCSDGFKPYRQATRHLGLTHRSINLSAGIRIVAKVYHIQNVNAYHSRLKGWMARFYGVATKYLENYLGWRRWLERSGRANSPSIAIWTALGRESNFQQLTQT